MSARSLASLLLGALQFSAYANWESCRDALNQGRFPPRRIDLGYQLPPTTYQGYNGVCYAHAVTAGLAAARYRLETKDVRPMGGLKESAWNYDYMPEWSMLLLTIADPAFVAERVRHQIEKKNPTLFTGGFSNDTSNAFLRTPDVLVSVPRGVSFKFLSSLRDVIASEFTSVDQNVIGLGRNAEQVRRRAHASVLKILTEAERKPELSGFLAQMRRNGFSWNAAQKTVSYTRRQAALAISNRNYWTPQNDFDIGCTEVKRRIYTAVCKGIPVMLAFWVPGQETQSAHAAVVMGITASGGRPALLLRDSQQANSEGDQDEPHTGLVNLPLPQICDKVKDRPRVYGVSVNVTTDELSFLNW